MLLTGFQGYGGRAVNPAEEVVKALDGAAIGAQRVTARTLPVSFTKLGPGIAQLIEETRPSVVICLGLWPGEPVIRLERVAVNIADFEIADNEGTIKQGPVVAGGPAAYETTLPIHEIQDRLLKAAIPARLSGSAGIFLCNTLMYHALHYCMALATTPRAGFVHLPYLPEQIATLIEDTRAEEKLELHQRADLASMSLDTMVEALRCAFEVSLEAAAEG